MERKNKIKDKNEILFKFFLGASIFFFILIIAFAVYLTPRAIPELTQGNSAQGFCSSKCGDNDVYTSNNNSNFDFIRCECIIEVGSGSPSYTRAAAPSIKTDVLFFDSISFGELTKEEVLERIK